MSHEVCHCHISLTCRVTCATVQPEQPILIYILTLTIMQYRLFDGCASLCFTSEELPLERVAEDPLD